MKLNVGCGEFYADGWVNLDMASNDRVKPDVIGSLTKLPDEVRDVTDVYLGHVLEHLEFHDAVAALITLWRRCVVGARVAVVGPDVVRARRLRAQGKITERTLQGAIKGDMRWAGDEHRWLCHETKLCELLLSSGLRVVAVPITSAKLNGFPVVSRAAWQCAAIGYVVEGNAQ